MRIILACLLLICLTATGLAVTPEQEAEALALALFLNNQKVPSAPKVDPLPKVPVVPEVRSVPVKPVPAPVRPPQPSRQRYPVISRNRWYTHNGHYLTSYQHLTEGVHRGKFDTTWLRSLSYEELNSLHSDHHRGAIKWNFVVRPAQRSGYYVNQRVCDGYGHCRTIRVWVPY